MELAVAMYEGDRKYGRHNYRATKIVAEDYYNALQRHMMAWWEGEDEDPDCGLSHITKAIATLVVLRDAMMRDMWVDDRPPRGMDGMVMEDLNYLTQKLNEKYLKRAKKEVKSSCA
jgi:hypothetical protein